MARATCTSSTNRPGEEADTDTVAEAWLPPIDLEGLDHTQLLNAAPNPTRFLPEFSPELHWGASGWSRGVLGLVELGVQTVVVKRVVSANPRP